MKSLRRGSVLTMAAMAAIGAAYVGWSGSAAVVATRTPPATVEAVALAASTPNPAQASDWAVVDAVALAGRSGEGALAASLPAPNVLDATNACPFCLEGTDPAAFDAEPSDILAQQSFSAGAADFDDSLNGFAGSTSYATAAPASEISTAAMATLGAIALTARRARRKGRPHWRAPWRFPSVPQSC